MAGDMPNAAQKTEKRWSDPFRLCGHRDQPWQTQLRRPWLRSFEPGSGLVERDDRRALTKQP